MDAAFFLALLSLVDAIGTKRIAMTPRIFATLFSLQTVSELSMVMAPTAWWLGPLRWRVPWAAQVALEKVRELLGGKNAVAVVEDIIHNDLVKRQ
jgi:nucleoside permease NupC